MSLLAAFASAAIVSAFLTPLVAAAARRLGIEDVPDGRRFHSGRVPRLGGVAIAAAFLGVSTVALYAVGIPRLSADTPDAPTLVMTLLGVSAAALVLGVADDRWDLSPKRQLAAQLAIGGIAVVGRLWLQYFTNPLTGQTIDLEKALPGALGIALVVGATLLWYAGFANTVNWLDGVNGLACGVAAIAAILFALHMVLAFEQWSLALLPATLAGACLGFMPANLRGRVFMGSSGSTFLGLTLAGLALMAPAKVATALLVMAVPIVDVAWQIVGRLTSGSAPWQADRGHLHHRLYDRGWGAGKVVAVYLVLAGVPGTVAVLLPQASDLRAGIKLGVLAGVAALALVWLWYLARQPMSRRTPPGLGGSSPER